MTGIGTRNLTLATFKSNYFTKNLNIVKFNVIESAGKVV